VDGAGKPAAGAGALIMCNTTHKSDRT